MMLAGFGVGPMEHAQRVVHFEGTQGVVTPERVVELFGNGKAPTGRDFGAMRDAALVVTYKQGKKVNETGFCVQPKVPARQQYTIEYRIKYPLDFQKGLHGKQLGLSGGKGYDGGRGEEARANGDGWSVRMQFDAGEKEITNQLYVYHNQMPAKYGDSLGTNKQRFGLKRGEWHTIQMRVTMQSAAEVADGRIEVWQDGQKRFDVEGVKFVAKEEGRQIDKVRFEMFTGGGGEFPDKDYEVLIDYFKWTDGDME
jgi:hypothetical protein